MLEVPGQGMSGSRIHGLVNGVINGESNRVSDLSELSAHCDYYYFFKSI